MHLVHFTRVSGTLTVYVDGVPITSASDSTNINPSKLVTNDYVQPTGTPFVSSTQNIYQFNYSNTGLNQAGITAQYNAFKTKYASLYETASSFTGSIPFYIGDSIGQGFPNGQAGTTPSANIFKYLVGAGKTINRQYNISQGGITLATIISQFSTSYAPFLAKITGTPVVIIHAGTNDIAVNNSTGAQTYALLTQLISLVKAANSSAKVAIATMLPRGNPQSLYETQRQAYNTLIHANAGGTYGFAGIADVVISFDGNTTLETLNTTNYPDYTHPIPALTQIMGQTVAGPAIASYF